MGVPQRLGNVWLFGADSVGHARAHDPHSYGEPRPNATEDLGSPLFFQCDEEAPGSIPILTHALTRCPPVTCTIANDPARIRTSSPGYGAGRVPLERRDG